MKLDGCWHMDVLLERWHEQYETLRSLAKITPKRIFKPAAKPRPRIKHIPLPVQTPTEIPEYPDIDPFSAQLVACREQVWWEPQVTDPFSDSDDSESYHSSESSISEQSSIGVPSQRRSISIREIRERMNSQQSMTSSLSSGHYEFESGLKLLDERSSWRNLGRWRDMETFVD